jgi:cytochrome c2
MRLALALLSLALLSLALAACAPDPEITAAEILPGADSKRGKELIQRYGCGSCHSIPGVPGADALVGPALERFGLRSFIAGRLPNTPDNLVTWIHNPKQVDEKTAMPNIGISKNDAVHIARYLYGLR